MSEDIALDRGVGIPRPVWDLKAALRWIRIPALVNAKQQREWYEPDKYATEMPFLKDEFHEVSKLTLHTSARRQKMELDSPIFPPPQSIALDALATRDGPVAPILVGQTSETVMPVGNKHLQESL